MDSLQYLNGLAVVWLIFDGCRCRLVVRPKTKHFVKELFDTRGKWSLRVASGSEWNSCDHGVRVFMQPCSLVQLCHELVVVRSGRQKRWTGWQQKILPMRCRSRNIFTAPGHREIARFVLRGSHRRSGVLQKTQRSNGRVSGTGLLCYDFL